MRILLLAHGKRTIPRGLADIYAFLRQRGYSVEFRHLYGDLSKLDTIDGTPDYVGISSFTTNSPDTIELAKRAYQRWPKSKIVLGGRHICDDILEHEQGLELLRIADYLVVGDGEYAMLDIIEGNPDQVIHGRLLSDDDYRNLPLPDMDFVKANFRDETHGVLLTRGCPFDCLFCGDHRSNLAYKEPEVAVAYLSELSTAVERPLFLYDDVFTANKVWLREFVAEYARQKATFRMRCFIHARCFNEDVMELLLSVGTHHVSLGAESGDDNVLHVIGKHTTTERYRKIHATLAGSSITLLGLWMLGNISDTNETMRRTVELSRQVGNTVPWFSFAIPFPGTKFWHVAKDYGKIIDWNFSHWDNRHVIFLPHGVTEGDLHKWKRLGTQR